MRPKKASSIFRWVGVAFLLIAIAVTALILLEPYIPGEFGFSTADFEARRKYEEIVTKHGYEYRHQKNVRGEIYVVIEGITPREYQPLECAFYAWSAERSRSEGVIVYDREDCAL